MKIIEAEVATEVKVDPQGPSKHQSQVKPQRLGPGIRETEEETYIVQT